MQPTKPQIMLSSVEKKKPKTQSVGKVSQNKGVPLEVPPRKSVSSKKSPQKTSRQTSQRQLQKSKVPLVISYRARSPQDDGYILQLSRQQLGTIHEQAFGQPFPDAQFMRYIQSGAPTFIILKNDQAIGYYSYLISQDGKMHISALVIESEHQSTGIGSQVMKRLEADAAKQGVKVLEVFVQEQNTTSLAFTKSLGFQEAFRIPPFSIAFRKVIA